MVFGWLFGSKTKDPVAVREEVMAAARANVPWRFFSLCREHQDAIAEQFGDWLDAPPERSAAPGDAPTRSAPTLGAPKASPAPTAEAEALATESPDAEASDAEAADAGADVLAPDAAAEHMHILLTIAKFFAEKLDRPELFAEIAKRSPLQASEQRLRDAREAMEELRYAEAAEALASLVEDLGELASGAAEAVATGAKDLRARADGDLGRCLFMTRRLDEAAAPLERALARCRETDDAEGVLASLELRYELARYAGDQPGAAAFAGALAEAYAAAGQEEAARALGARVPLITAGEPSCRVVVLVDGRPYELDALPDDLSEDSDLDFTLERNRTTLHPSEAAVARGAEHLAEARYDDALAEFASAAALDPHCPDPAHQAALALCYLERYDEALARFDDVERLAPGWFESRAERWLAAEVAAGRLTHAVFMAIDRAERGNLDAETAHDTADDALDEAPAVAWLRLLKAHALFELEEGDEAEAELRAALAAEGQEPSVRSRILVDLASVTDSADERRTLLEEAVALEGANLTVQAMARVFLLTG